MAKTRPIDAFEQAVWQELDRMTSPEATLHLAVSGGRDSVALTHCVCRSPDTDRNAVRLIHVDHQIRPDSAGDAAFVEQLANRVGVACDIASTSPPSTGARASEDFARRVRYDAIAATVSRNGGKTLLMAHTADDQAETVLHRLIRGTGIRGLRGIPEKRLLGGGVTLVRPMLKVTRSAVTAYLHALGESWRDDPTNAELDYTRNLIRNQLLPSLRDQLNPQINDALLRLAESARDSTTLVEQLVNERLAAFDGPTNTVPLDLLRGCQEPLVAECLREIWRRNGWPEQGMTRKHWHALIDLVETNKSNRELHLPAGITVKRMRTALVFDVPE